MSPYLLLGFLFAGILHVFFPEQKIKKYLGKSNAYSVFNAALIGVPLPLCSCGVIPTGISFYKHGASKGSSVSFLISTPQTGIDSILVTYSLLGLPFAIIRPIIALITGFFGGLLTNFFGVKDKEQITSSQITKKLSSKESHAKENVFIRMFRYAFVDFLGDIAKWVLIGLLIAAGISVLVPDDFFSTYIENDFLDMLIILVAAIPLYVCATASVPIAAILMMKGLSPGAALVFLMAGPATNAATMTIITKVLGKKTLFTYLFSIIAGALFFGTLINLTLPDKFFLIPEISQHTDFHHTHGILPLWLKNTSSILLIVIIINVYLQKFIKSKKFTKEITQTKQEVGKIKTVIIVVNGMTCNHCKMNVENKITSIGGINKVEVDLSTKKVKISGENIDLGKIKEGVESIGYEYGGVIK